MQHFSNVQSETSIKRMQDEESTLKFDLKKDWLATLIGAIGLVLLIVGILGATVFRPADTVTASATTTAPAKAVFTRGGVLGLFKTPVTITAKTEGNEKLTMVVGRSYDVAAFAASLNAAEVKGLTTWENLELAAPATVNNNITPEPVKVSESDLWNQTVLGNGEVVLTLEDLSEDLSVIIVSEDKELRYTITLSWPYRAVTYWQWVVLGFGIALLIAAGLVLWWMRRNSRENEESKSETEIQIPVAPEADSRLEKSPSLTQELTSAETELPVVEEVIIKLDDAPANEAPAEPEMDSNETESDGEAVADDAAATEAESKTEESLEEAEVSESGTEETATAVEPEPQPGEERASEQPAAELENIETTESGSIIAITTATGQIRLPSRGALRTARERGEAKMEIDGVVYETGVIPAVHVEKGEEDAVEPLQVPEDSSAEVEKMINEAKAAGQNTGVRPGESLWERLRRYRGGSSTNQSESEGDGNA
ncbi:PepSY domain-containing protein [Boudabousia marimammalium]|uniref:Uncharacterized protein n=1 Tax=Boudabousia marimammalium TaxID=156892 RepID=A0A1Q5PRE9_9ACTO|nr:PepSY domain-containing protein [Boudabousia marimammalium]OKL50154.1 hypothetical protein BM477_01800 [Boudabousia marimammalium]